MFMSTKFLPWRQEKFHVFLAKGVLHVEHVSGVRASYFLTLGAKHTRHGYLSVLGCAW